jgi:hypothetical protein
MLGRIYGAGAAFACLNACTCAYLHTHPHNHAHADVREYMTIYWHKVCVHACACMQAYVYACMHVRTWVLYADVKTC